MKILFAGTPEIAVPSLKVLSREFEIAGVLTAPDKISGRGRKITPSPVKKAALDLNLKVLQPERLGRDAREETASLNADILVVFAYGKIFGPKFLDLFPLGGINMHPSALPKYRGPSPVTAVILAGEKETALTVQKIALKLDSGDIIRQTPFPLDGSETTESLTRKISESAPGELSAALKQIEQGQVNAVAQDESKATYCRIIVKEDGIIDWNKPASVLEREVRAYYPWPKSVTSLNGSVLTVLKAKVVLSGIPDNTVEDSKWYNRSVYENAVPGTVLGVDKLHGILIKTGRGVLGVLRLQLASRKPLDFKSFLNGVKMENGTVLGDN